MLGLTPDIDSERVKLEDFLREVKEVLSQTIEVKTKQVESKLVTHTLGKRNASALEKGMKNVSDTVQGSNERSVEVMRAYLENLAGAEKAEIENTLPALPAVTADFSSLDQLLKLLMTTRSANDSTERQCELSESETAIFRALSSCVTQFDLSRVNFTFSNLDTTLSKIEETERALTEQGIKVSNHRDRNPSVDGEVKEFLEKSIYEWK